MTASWADPLTDAVAVEKAMIVAGAANTAAAPGATEVTELAATIEQARSIVPLTVAETVETPVIAATSCPAPEIAPVIDALPAMAAVNDPRPTTDPATADRAAMLAAGIGAMASGGELMTVLVPATVTAGSVDAGTATDPPSWAVPSWNPPSWELACPCGVDRVAVIPDWMATVAVD